MANIIFNLTRGSIGLTFSIIRHTIFDDSIFVDKYIREVVYYLISELKFCIWICRNYVKFEHREYNANALLLFFVSRVKDRITLDFTRFDVETFKS